MHLMTPTWNDNDSFKYSILLYLCYYNIKTNKNRVTQIDNDTTPHLPIRFNTDNDIFQFEDENKYIDLSIINIIR